MQVKLRNGKDTAWRLGLISVGMVWMVMNLPSAIAAAEDARWGDSSRGHLPPESRRKISGAAGAHSL
jgi:hypothetical protein